ncbi:MAG: transporter substrate-binding domain-containing protein [Spirochaetaceae bacterium]|nr:transporter substrate-binding domain-containing protein [Spirochaetaceae bacterium]
MKKCTGCLLAALFLISFCFANQNAGDTIKVGYYENEVFQEGGAPGAVKTGYAYEYYRKISEYTGWKYEYVYGSYTDLYNLLLEGKIDLLAGLAWKESRKNIIAYPEAAMGSETYSLVKHESDSSINANYNTLNDKTIGVLNSAMVDTLEKFLRSHNVKAIIVPFDDYDLLFQAFDSAQVDVLAAEGDGAYGRESAEILYPFGASDYFLCVSVHRPDLLAQLNTAQAQLMTEEPNYISSLRAKYYPVSISSRAFSDTEKEWLASNASLKVGYLNDYLPYSDITEDGSANGIIKELIPQLLERLAITNIQPVYKGFDSYDDMIEAMNDSEVDVIFPVGGGLYFSEENGIYQSNAVTASITELVFLHDSDHINSKTFAINQNNRMQYYYVINNFPEAKIVYYPSINECLDAVLSGKVDCTTINGLRSDILKNRKYRNLSMHQLKTSDDRCFGIQIGNEGLLKLINRGMNIVGTEYAQELSYKYSQQLYDYSISDFIKDHMYVFGSLLLIVVVIILVLLVRDSKHYKAALDAVENANRAKTIFLNNMSHDIRTPMNAIVNFTELAQSSVGNKEQTADYLSKISVSSKHLLSLINDVLDMSRIESEMISLAEETINIAALIEDLQTIIQPTVAEKRQNFSVDFSKIENQNIITDKLRLNQILLNILSNAIKFTNEGGSISLNVSEEEVKTENKQPQTSVYEFRIKDNGIGMSRDFQKIIFDSFTRERTSTVSGIQGTGLGMAITKKIVDMLGGTIQVQSEEGHGSEFIVRLPCKISSEKTEQIDKSEPAKDALVQADFSGKRVLLAEDNEMNQMIAVANLENAGFAVEVANDGVEALEKVRTNPAGYYDVILMDIQMPKMDGYEAARRIRALPEPEKASVPIVAVTANTFGEDCEAALKAGMNKHLAKPYDIPQIIQTIYSLLYNENNGAKK